VAVVRLTGLLAQEAGARRLSVEAATLREALRALPVGGLVLDEHGELRPLVHAYVDRERLRELDTKIGPTAEIVLIAAIAGGS
jgi:molybdopterin converting factor small subunit